MGELIEHPPLTAAARWAADQPAASDALLSLGSQLVDVGVPDLAVPVLQRALQLAPDDRRVVLELIGAWEDYGRHAEAVALLTSRPGLLDDDFYCMYLLAFNTLMAGDLAGARAALARLPAPVDADETAMRDRVQAMLRRADVTAPRSPLDHTDLRGWHFVITGGLLLARSPYGLEEGLHGRWGYVSDSYELCYTGLQRAAAVLQAWDRRPRRVLALPDRDSQALGQAAAFLLDVELRTWTPDADAGLVVAYDLKGAEADALQALHWHRPEQPLYAHAACWTHPPPVAPDLVTVLYQALTQPWGEQVRLPAPGDGSGQSAVERVPADPAQPEALAARILTADAAFTSGVEIDTADTVEQVVAFATAVADVAAGTRDHGRRERLWAGGPVASGRLL